MRDLALCTYWAMALVATFGSVLFVWWLMRNRFRATSVYLYVTVLFVGEAVRSWINIQGRLHALENDGSFLIFSLGWFWPGRNILSLLAITAIVVHMSYRVLVGKNPEVPEQWSDKVRSWFGDKTKSK